MSSTNVIPAEAGTQGHGIGLGPLAARLRGHHART